MDKLAEKLRRDAAGIDADISAELDSRIRASLLATAQQPDRPHEPRRRPLSFWLASTLTGVATALVLIAVLNVIDTTEPVAVTRTAADDAARSTGLPALDLDVEAATLTQELEDLQADLKKAEEVVRRDVRIDF